MRWRRSSRNESRCYVDASAEDQCSASIMKMFARRESWARAEPQSAIALSATLKSATIRYDPTMADKR